MKFKQFKLRKTFIFSVIVMFMMSFFTTVNVKAATEPSVGDTVTFADRKSVV